MTEVLSRADLKERRDVIACFIAVALKAKALGAFNTTMELVAGLNNGAVQRLKKTWAELGKKDLQAFEELEAFVSPKKSFSQLREAKQRQLSENQPCVPYLGLYLSDLVMIDEGTSGCALSSSCGLIPPAPPSPHIGSKAELSPGVVNFSKCVALADTISEIMHFAAAPVAPPRPDTSPSKADSPARARKSSFIGARPSVQPKLRSYLTSAKLLADDDMAWQTSESLEPRL